MNLNRATLLSDALKKDETGPCQAQPAKTIRRKKSLKKSLTLRSDALQKDDERPAQPPDCALQAAAEPGQKYGSMAASPYRQMKKGQRRPHGVGPKDPKHGFFGALPLRQRGRRIYYCVCDSCPVFIFVLVFPGGTRNFLHRGTSQPVSPWCCGFISNVMQSIRSLSIVNNLYNDHGQVSTVESCPALRV